jgi:outer membrane protein assembly factor BamB
MKAIRLSLFLLALGTLAACNKKKSGDPPLDKVHYEAVFVTTDNNNVVSYEANTGTKLWEIHTTGNVEGTPVYYKGNLYAYTNTGFLYSIDVVEKDTNWRVQVASNGQASLAAYNDRIYVAADRLYAVNLDGTLSWNYDPAAPCTSSPQVSNGVAYVAAGDKIHAVDAVNGSGIWISAATPSQINSSVRVSNGIVYFGCEDMKVYAYNASDGTPRWNFTTGDRVVSSPAVYGGMCLVGSYDFNLYCIDTTTGLQRWAFPTLERVHSSPAIHEATNSVVVGSYDYNLYCIDHVSGTLRWKYPAAGLIKSSPVISGNHVYFTSYDRYLYCVDVRDGRTLWKQFMDANSSSSPVVDDTGNGVHPGISGNSTY